LALSNRNPLQQLLVDYIKGVYVYFDSNVKLLKAKFHHTLQVADLVADLVSDLSQTGSSYVEMARTSVRPAFDPKSHKLVADPHELVESQVCDQVCDPDSVMEFDLNCTTLVILSDTTIRHDTICYIFMSLKGDVSQLNLPHETENKNRRNYKCGPMPNVMAALPNIGGALCSTPKSLADAHY